MLSSEAALHNVTRVAANRKKIDQTIGLRARMCDAEISWQRRENFKMICYYEGTRIDVVPLEQHSWFEIERHGARKKIDGFTARSRKALLKLMASLKIEEEKLPIFITLTYPANWDSDPKKWKRDLDLFGKWLVYTYPKIAFIWKLEPQERGAPHYHLMCFNVDFIPAELVARRWYEIVGSGDLFHLKAGTETRRVRSKQGVMYYASKRYMGKECKGFGYAVGRYWGVIARKKMPVSAVMEFDLSVSAEIRFRRLVRKYLEHKGYSRCIGKFGKFTLFTNAMLDWAKAADWASEITAWLNLQRGIPF